ncbi:MAG: ATP--guanido phosphotransferase, partial [Verrucomicrobia bacterium]
MKAQDLIHEKSELTNGKLGPEPIVLSTRIRLARNLEGFNFPDWSSVEKRIEVLDLCAKEIKDLSVLENAEEFDCEDMTEIEKGMLVERHLISPEFAQKGEGSGVIINKEQSVSVMINEEDHLRIQVLRNGYQFKSAWQAIDELDNQIDARLDYAFSGQLGYLTACPTNLGTG